MKKNKKITLANVKKKWRWKARSQMSPEELDFFLEYVDKKRSETIMLKEMLARQNLNAAAWIIVSPMFLPVERKTTPDKKISLNMNGYRNWDFITSDNLKKDYKEIMKPYIAHLTKLSNVHIEYRIFYGKNEPDGMNIAAVQSKFFLDALQGEKDEDGNQISPAYIDNDNISNVTESYSSWWKEIWNERIEILITKK